LRLEEEQEDEEEDQWTASLTVSEEEEEEQEMRELCINSPTSTTVNADTHKSTAPKMQHRGK